MKETAYQKKWRKENRERVNLRIRERRRKEKELNPEGLREKERKERLRWNPEGPKEAQRKWRERNRDRIRNTRQAIRYKILIYYGGNPPTCKCCGESRLEFLALDHKLNDGYKYRKEGTHAGGKLYSWIEKNKYPDIFQVLCHNCNSSKGLYGYCPHEKERENLCH